MKKLCLLIYYTPLAHKYREQIWPTFNRDYLSIFKLFDTFLGKILN